MCSPNRAGVLVRRAEKLPVLRVASGPDGLHLQPVFVRAASGAQIELLSIPS